MNFFFVGDMCSFAIFIPVLLHTRANMRIYFRKKSEILAM